MEGSGEHNTKHINVGIHDDDRLYQVTRALANKLRIDILRALGKKSMMSIHELATVLNVPVSSVALGVRILEEADLIFTESVPGAHGMLKLSSRKTDTIGISLVTHISKSDSVLTMEMPVGGYSKVGNIKPTCGLASVNSAIGEDDNSRSFYAADRFNAQLLWFRQGFVEYRFSVLRMDEIHIDWLELSFEACSEAPMYRDPWESDITVAINGRTLGVWTSPCDCGDHRGRLNPAWWSDVATQHGFLKAWRVDESGCYLDNVQVSATRLSDLQLLAHDSISVRIAVEPDAKHVGGLNLFGKQFGDFEQGIVMRIGYRVAET